MLVECSLISFLFSFSSIFLFRFQKKRESGVGSEVSDPFSVSPPRQMALEEVGVALAVAPAWSVRRVAVPPTFSFFFSFLLRFRFPASSPPPPRSLLLFDQIRAGLFAALNRRAKIVLCCSGKGRKYAQYGNRQS